MKIHHIFMAVFVTFLWGLNFSVTKIVIAELPLFFVLALRYMLVAIVLLPFYPKPPTTIKYLCVMSVVFGVLNAGLRFLGMRLGLAASLVVVVDKLSVPYSVLLSVVFLNERIRWRTICGITISLFGIFVLSKTSAVSGNILGFVAVSIGSFFLGLI